MPNVRAGNQCWRGERSLFLCVCASTAGYIDVDDILLTLLAFRPSNCKQREMKLCWFIRAICLKQNQDVENDFLRTQVIDTYSKRISRAINWEGFEKAQRLLRLDLSFFVRATPTMGSIPIIEPKFFSNPIKLGPKSRNYPKPNLKLGLIPSPDLKWIGSPKAQLRC